MAAGPRRIAARYAAAASRSAKSNSNQTRVLLSSRVWFEFDFADRDAAARYAAARRP